MGDIVTSKKMQGTILLFLTAFIWGAAFVAQKIGTVHVGTFTFITVRFLISGIVLLPYVIYSIKKQSIGSAQTMQPLSSARDRNKVLLIGGILCGVFLALATIFQQMGINFTTAGKAGFITALYIILVPILGIFNRKKVTPVIWICVLVAVAGLYLLCVQEGFSVNKGDALVLLCAVFFSFHIMIIDKYSPLTNGIQMSCIQFFTAALISGILMLLFEKPDLTSILNCWAPLLYLGVVSGAIGYTLQILGQKHAEPATASLILSTESVFAAIAGTFFLNESFNVRELIGCVLVFGAIIWSQISTTKKTLPLKNDINEISE